MKITIELPTERIKATAATMALLGGETLPADFAAIADSTHEIDITDSLQEDGASKMAMTAIAMMTVNKIIDKCKDHGTTNPV